MSTTAPDLHTYWATTHTSKDPWTYAMHPPGWEDSYQPLRRGPYYWSRTAAWLGPLELVHEHISNGWLWRGQGWKGSRIFLCNDGGSLNVNDRLIPGHELVSYQWHGLRKALSPSSTSVVFVSVDERWLIDRLSESTGIEFTFRDEGHSVLYPCGRPVQNFQREMPEILRQLVAEPAILDFQASRASVQNHVVDLLVQILNGGESAKAPLPRPSTRAYVVDRAMQYIESAIGDKISIPDICGALRVPASTLRYSFESVLGISPSRYLLATRLSRVHADLLTSPPDVSIQQLAARWGFWHMGRFAKYYHETFGERPSETGRAAAGPGTAGSNPS